MKANLDTLRTEIRDYLESRGLAVFHGLPRAFDERTAVYWNTPQYNDYRAFATAAETSGVKLIALNALEFNESVIDSALEQLQEHEMPLNERRPIEKRLRELRAYSGFTCQIELSFDLAPRVYVFDLRTEWFDELNDMLDSIDESFEGEQDDDEGDVGEPHAGYFSKN
jgi:hypothetical protein